MKKELVRHLAESAGFDVYSDEIYSPYIEGTPIDEQVEQLVKIVIHECCNLVDSQYWSDPHEVYEAMDMIQVYFGLKELGDE